MRDSLIIIINTKEKENSKKRDLTSIKDNSKTI